MKLDHLQIGPFKSYELVVLTPRMKIYPIKTRNEDIEANEGSSRFINQKYQVLFF